MKRIIVTLMAALLLSPVSVMAQDAGTTRLNTKADGTGDTCKVRTGVECFYRFASIVHSAVFVVESKYADICLLPSTASGAVVSIRYQITAPTLAGSFIPDAESTSTLSGSTGDCFLGKNMHKYYLQVITPPSSGTATVSVMGRDG